jgi:NAD-dependent dihydropyrimidine dehydrogenase PreA subunit
MPVVAYEQDCVWCFTCEINCPAECINVIPQIERQPVNPY